MRFLRYITLFLVSYFAISGLAQTGFTENKGQFHSKVSYRSDVGQFKVFLDDSGFTVLLHDESVWSQIAEEFHENKGLPNSRNKSAERTLGFQSIKYLFENANWSSPVGVRPEAAYYNYFLGNDKAKWASHVKSFEKVLFSDVYPNIDVEFVVLDRRFKYNFILRPGADIEDIKFKIKGAEYNVGKNRITVDTRFGPLDEEMPISYWVSEEGKSPAQVWYVEEDGYIQLRKVKTKKNSSLVIDPELIFATYSGSSLDNFGFTATYDAEGNLYSGGIVLSPTSNPRSRGQYPVTPGAFDVVYNGGTFAGVDGNDSPCDIAISKYSTDGSTLIYATYLGGSSNEYPHSLIVDDQNQLIVYGTTFSDDYPITNNAYQNRINGNGISSFTSDIILTKLSNDATRLMGSTFFGGSQNDGLNEGYGVTRDFYADEFRGEVNLDREGKVYVASCTYSSDIRTTNGVFQSSYAGRLDGLVFTMNDDFSDVIWSSYFGGEGDDAIYSIDFSRDNNYVYVSGGTNTTALSSANAEQPAFQGRTDGFIAKISNDGTSQLATSYVGTVGYDQVMGLHIDTDDYVYVVGSTDGNIQATSGTYVNENSGQFIAKYDNELTTQLLVTTFGSGSGRPDITLNAFLVDECGKIFVSGWGGNTDDKGIYTFGNRLGDMPLTPDALQRNTDGNDFYIIVFTEELASLDYASYLGGNRSSDHVDGGTSRFDERGIIYQSVCSSCPSSANQFFLSDFPVTDGAYQERNLSYRCSNASFKYAAVNFNAAPITDDNDFFSDVADTITVSVFDTFEFSHQIIDPEGDSIFAFFDFPESLKNDVIDLQEYFIGGDTLNVNFRIFFTCKNAFDTFRIRVRAWDNGCPTTEEDSSVITIVVNPPDPLPPPEVVCLFFQDDGSLRLEWQATAETEEFYRMMLYKSFPDGSEEVIGTFLEQDAGKYIDRDVIDPRNNDYSYYLRVENYCRVLGDSSILLSTVKESQIPVTPTPLKTVTVNGQAIEVHYLKSTEPDFDHYDIYRTLRTGIPNFQYYASIFNINDTVFMDTNVDVSETSYCYQVRVADNCGRVSPFTKKGCSIVIRGEAINNKGEKPRFKMDLTWDPYIDWDGGVQEYELLRSVDTGVLRPIVNIYSKYQNYRDENLDFDWGGYWYSVLAYEGPGSLNATSRSNDIYLIQPPLVFVPNAVTANGDNLNEIFGWSDVFVREFVMKVYNRWGEKVYETTDKNAEWSGEYKDDYLPYSNVYFWIVTYKGWDNERHNANGTVTILK